MASEVAPVEYRDIKGFPNYRVGNDGSVWSCWLWGGGKFNRATSEWRRLAAAPDKHGYRKVTLNREKKPHYRKVHRLVLEAFVGPCPAGMEGCHNNGDQLDCSLVNLRWDFPTGNAKDRIAHGRLPRGEKVASAKLTESHVRDIKAALATGARKSVLAKSYGVSPSAIHEIAKGKNWAWVIPTPVTEGTVSHGI